MKYKAIIFFLLLLSGQGYSQTRVREVNGRQDTYQAYSDSTYYNLNKEYIDSVQRVINSLNLYKNITTIRGQIITEYSEIRYSDIHFAQISIIPWYDTIITRPSPSNRYGFRSEFFRVKKLDTTYTTMTDFDGNFEFVNIPQTGYTLTIKTHGFEPKTFVFESIDNEKLFLGLEIVGCSYFYPLRPCPICRKTNKVIRVDYEKNKGYSFSNPHLKEKKENFQKMMKELGYYSHIENQQELLFTVSDTLIQSKYDSSSICDQLLFCKKDKIIF